jgi:hypothetical protein
MKQQKKMLKRPTETDAKAFVEKLSHLLARQLS